MKDLYMYLYMILYLQINRQIVYAFFYQDKSYQLDDVVGCGKSHLKFLLFYMYPLNVLTSVLDKVSRYSVGCQKGILACQFPLLPSNHCKIMSY